MVLYQIVILGEADDPQGLKEALAMACEAVGSAKVTKVEVLSNPSAATTPPGQGWRQRWEGGTHDCFDYV